MRIRTTVVALVAMAGLTACSSSGSTSGGGSTGGGGGTTTGTTTSATSPTGGGSSVSVAGNSAICARLRAVAEQVTKTGGSFSNPTDAKAEIERTIVVLKAVGDGAPAEVQNAVNDLIAGLKDAEGAFNGGVPDFNKLSKLGPKLATDGSVITSYVENSCIGK